MTGDYSCRNNTRRGFALVSTLLLIAIAAVLLAGISRISVRRSLHSIAMGHESQSRWALASCQRAVFENVDDLLSEKRVSTDEGSVQIQRRAMVVATAELNGETFDMLISDESAKLDLNVVLRFGNQREVRLCTQELSDLQSAFINLRPLPLEKRNSLKRKAFETWDQIFSSVDGIPATPVELMAGTAKISCWGKRVCLGSASDEVLSEVCRTVAGDVIANEVVNARRDNPGIRVNDLVKTLSIPDQNKVELESVLANSSISQSLWVVARPRDGQPARFSFTINEGFAPSVYRLSCFCW